MPNNDNVTVQVASVPLIGALSDPPDLDSEDWKTKLEAWLFEIRLAVDENAASSDRSLSALKTAVTEPFVKVTAATFAVTDDNYALLADATAAPITLTLPPAADVLFQVFTVKRLNSGANSVTIDVSGGGTIDEGLTAVIITQYTALRIVSDGTEYWIF